MRRRPRKRGETRRGEHLPVDDHAGGLERRRREPPPEPLRDPHEVALDPEPGRRSHRCGERARQHALLRQPGRGVETAPVANRHPTSDQEDTTAALREPVIGGVHHPPLGDVAQVREAGKHDRHVAAPLVRGRLQQSVDVLEEDGPGTSRCDDAVDLPPQHALLPLDARRGVQRSGHRVVLAREPAHQQIVRGDVVGHRLDVGVDRPARAEPRHVAVEGVLYARRWLPLVRPDGPPARALQAQTEPADPREQLHDLARRHAADASTGSVPINHARARRRTSDGAGTHPHRGAFGTHTSAARSSTAQFHPRTSSRGRVLAASSQRSSSSEAGAAPSRPKNRR